MSDSAIIRAWRKFDRKAIAVSVTSMLTVGAIVGISSPAYAIKSCGDAISINGPKWSGFKFSYKIVGVGLNEFLGNGNGHMEYYATVEPSTNPPFDEGNVNASGRNGARTGVLTLSPVETNQTVYITVDITFVLGDTPQCISNFSLPVSQYT